jgi:hypothetical protein
MLLLLFQLPVYNEVCCQCISVSQCIPAEYIFVLIIRQCSPNQRCTSSLNTMCSPEGIKKLLLPFIPTIRNTYVLAEVIFIHFSHVDAYRCNTLNSYKYNHQIKTKIHVMFTAGLTCFVICRGIIQFICSISYLGFSILFHYSYCI